MAELANEKLQALEIEVRIDHRTLEEQGIDREPTVHFGPSVQSMERRGLESKVGFRIREDARERLERAYELGLLEREGRSLEKSILVLDNDVLVALDARDARHAHEREAIEGDQATASDKGANLSYDPEESRPQARERWREYRRRKELAQAVDLGPEKGAELDSEAAEIPEQNKDVGYLLDESDDDTSL